MSDKIKLLLDLDNTLICSEPPEEINNTLMRKIKECFKVHDMDGDYFVCERPYVQEFLTYVFKNFDVSVWTAASKDYAKFIIRKIIIPKDKSGNLKYPERKLDYFFWDRHCKISRKHKHGEPKSLQILWELFKIQGYTPQNTLILDDYKKVYKNQKCNSIPVIPPFEITGPNCESDVFLRDLIPKLEVMRKNPQSCLTGSFHNL